MNKFTFIGILVLSVMVIIIMGCKTDEDDIDETDENLKIIEGFTFNNYPKTDGSTSTDPLNVLIACKLLGIKHQWTRGGNGWYIEPVLKSSKNIKKFESLVKLSQTHQSFINLIDKKADVILSARKMSPDEKAYADQKGVSLIETPIALDGFVFIVNPENSITTLTIEQIQDIYTGKITNWNEVGGNDLEIYPFIRNANSGSHELMESMVMFDFGSEWSINREVISKEQIIYSMVPVFDEVSRVERSICYSIYYFKKVMLRDQGTKTIAINGIHPDDESIGNNSYPLSTEVYAIIRSDLDTSSTAYKLYEFIQTDLGKEVIKESGYLPY
jgi:phosphate transport system substrate-binding protein